MTDKLSWIFLDLFREYDLWITAIINVIDK